MNNNRYIIEINNNVNNIFYEIYNNLYNDT